MRSDTRAPLIRNCPRAPIPERIPRMIKRLRADVNVGRLRVVGFVEPNLRSYFTATRKIASTTSSVIVTIPATSV